MKIVCVGGLSFFIYFRDVLSLFFRLDIVEYRKVCIQTASEASTSLLSYVKLQYKNKIMQKISNI